MARVLWFKDIRKENLAQAGGKGANLGEMWNNNFPIPPGFVITAQTYKEFIEETGIKDRIISLLSGLDVEDTDKLQKAAEKVQELITSTEIPEEIKEEITDSYDVLGLKKKSGVTQIMEGKGEFVAVRSSATAEDLPSASFAGQQATFLNIRGREFFLHAVRDCWASLYTARAIYYRIKNNFPHEKVFIAVVVQKMVNSEKSGVMFTVNPSTNNLDEMVIEGALGLGEYVVSGTINPDLYIVDKKSLEITKRELKRQGIKLIRNQETGKNIQVEIDEEEEKLQVLSDREIVELARIGKKIEEHYSAPQDIEWAVEKGQIYIVQSRGITTLTARGKIGSKERDDGISRKDADTEEGKILVKGETACAGAASGPVVIIKDARELNRVKKGDVLVTYMTNPDMVPAMQKAAAIVTDEGGLTSHAAIVSREMGTPCIVGTEVATKILKEGQIVTVNATRGLVYEGIVEVKKIMPREVPSRSYAPSIVTATDVKLILDFPEKAEEASLLHVDGVGLVRLEFIIAEGGIHPAEYIRQDRDEDYTELLVKGIGRIAQAMKGKPVWVRNSDMRSDEYRNLEGGDKEPQETDPMIGWHAIRRLLDEPRILKAEFAAIKKLHEQGMTNVGIMIPFVIRAEEVKKAKEILREAGMEPCKDVEFGIMVETPAACWEIERICREGISFVSFGTNDLTQTTLGIDRNNERIQKHFDEMHPAVIGELAMVIRACKRHHVKTSICGQAGSRPEMVEFLVHQGIDSISVNMDVVDTVREIVAKTEKKLLLEAERRKN